MAWCYREWNWMSMMYVHTLEANMYHGMVLWGIACL